LTYYALDLDRAELVRSLQGLTSKYSYVKVAGLHGTYDDGIALLKHINKPKSILWLGSSIANMDRENSAAFLKSFPMNAGDSWVVGIDRRGDAFKVWRAYNDSQGVTREFELNGLRNANKILGKEEFKAGEWEYVGEYDADGGRHEAWFVPLKDVSVCDLSFKRGEKILVERSYKYNKREVLELWEESGVVEVGHWSDPSKVYGSFASEVSNVRCPCRSRCAILLSPHACQNPSSGFARVERTLESLGYDNPSDDSRRAPSGETNRIASPLYILYR
jgi:L-histidine Nalpha-methyltransferase / hercynylcysteine S-oxide synthase